MRRGRAGGRRRRRSPRDGAQPGPDELAEDRLRREASRRALDALPDRERIIAGLRYGLVGGEPTPLREIGRRLGLTPERVRQIEAAALAQLRRMPSVAALREAA